MTDLKMPDGKVLRFPDDTPDDVLDKAAKDYISQMPTEIGSGMMDAGKAQTLTGNYQRGALRGMLDIPDAGAQLLTRAIESLSPSGSGIEAWAKRQREQVEGINKEREGLYQAGKGEGSETGRLMGNLAATVPMSFAMPTGGASLVGRLGAGTGQGATMGALQPVEDGKDFWMEKLKQTGMGAGTGLAGAGVAEGLARAVAPKASSDPNVQRLMEAGIRPTPGQIMGGGLKRAEEKMASVPVLGGAIRGGQERAVGQFNRAAINESLEPLGVKLPMEVKPGREAIEWAGEKISKAYDDLLPKLSATVDETFAAEMTSLTNLAKNMPEARSRQFENVIKEQVVGKMSKSGTWTGESLKEIESQLGRLGSNYRSSADPDQRLLGDAFREAQAAIRRLIERSNPHMAKELTAANKAYSNFLRVENAAGRIGAREGVFSPEQLTGATRQMDKSFRHRAFSRGNAPMQDLAEAGKSVLGSRVPNSGTADRLLQALAVGGPIAAAEHFADPRIALAMLPALAYTRGGQSLAAHLLATRGPGAQPAADAIRAMYPMLGRGLALGGNSLFPSGP